MARRGDGKPMSQQDHAKQRVTFRHLTSALLAAILEEVYVRGHCFRHHPAELLSLMCVRLHLSLRILALKRKYPLHVFCVGKFAC